MATVIDLCSRRLLAAPTSEHPNAELACDAIRMAIAVRGGALNMRAQIKVLDTRSPVRSGSAKRQRIRDIRPGQIGRIHLGSRP